MPLIDRLWNMLSRHPWLAMTAMVAMQTAFTLNSRALWFSDEVRYANAYENMERAGAWVVLALNGVPYPDKPPLYFWFLSLLDHITPLDPPTIFFLGSALSGLLFIFAVYWLGQVLGFDRDRCLGAALVTLSTLFFAAILHYLRMDLMFAALIVASSAGLARTFMRNGSGAWGVLGLGLAGLAVLVKGPLGILFPLIALAAYLGWRGELKRFISLPVLLGLLLAAAVAACWVLAALVMSGPEFVRTLFMEQIFERATNTFHHKEGPFYYFAVLPAVWLPWTYFVAGLPVAKLLTREFWSKLLAGRKTTDPARTWLWTMLISAFVLLSCLSGKVVIYLLPLFAPLALLTSDALAKMNEHSLGRCFQTMAAFLLLMAAAIPFAGSFAPFKSEIAGLPLVATMLAALAVGLYLVRRNAKGALLVMALGVTLWIQPAALITAPSLDPIMSPKAQGELMGQYIDKGYVAAAYDTYSGIYTWYAGHDIIEIPKHFQELNKLCEENKRVIIAMKKKHLEKWAERPDTLSIIHEQWITDQPYILLIQAVP